MRKETHKNIPNNIWQLQEAKAKLSEVVEKANRDGYQIITRKGEPIVVVLSQVEFNRLHEPKRSLVEFFKKAPYPELDLDFERSRDLPREVEL